LVNGAFAVITYNGLELFSSGTSELEPGPLQSREAVMDTPGGIGASVIAQGVSARNITQRGTLAGDTEAELMALIQAIEAQVGLASATLTDAQGNDWPECFMKRFEPGPVFRLGPRQAVQYTITYLQTQS